MVFVIVGAVMFPKSNNRAGNDPDFLGNFTRIVRAFLDFVEEFMFSQ